MERPPPAAAARTVRWRGAVRLLFPAVAMAGLWILLTGGVAASWVVGVPTIAIALVALHRLWPRVPRWRIDPRGALRFAGFFLRESLRGGVDVAGRVSRRRTRIAPGLLEHAWRLPPDGPWRMLFALAISLLPGTLVARMDDDALVVHVLDTGVPVMAELAVLEQHVAALFGLDLVQVRDA